MTILEERTAHAIMSISQKLNELNKNIERLASALEKQNKLAEKVESGETSAT